jgi:hypothetical protein
MANRHDESKDLRLVGSKLKVDYADKTIQAPKSAIIGIRTWGRIDYLTHYCGWTFIWNNSVSVRTQRPDSDAPTKHKRESKKAAKEQTLTNKKKR